MVINSYGRTHLWFRLTYIALAYIGGIFNTVLIISVLKEKTMRCSPTYIVLVNLALADLLILTVSPSVQFYAYLNGSLSDGICILSIFTFRLTLVVSAYSVATFSVLRYLLICQPLFAKRHITARKMVVTCFIMWPVMMAENGFCFDAVTFGNAVTSNCFFAMCVFKPDYDIILGTLPVFDFVLPFLLISGFHVTKLVSFRKHAVQSQTSGAQKNVSARAVMAIIITYVLCNIFYNLMIFAVYLLKMEFSESIFPWLIVLSNVVLFNSIFNPVLYFFLSRCKHTFCC